jgi:hypothetical protein
MSETWTVPLHPPADPQALSARAVHEAGHAIVALALQLPLDDVTLRPSTDRAPVPPDATRVREVITMLCAGVEAERLLVPQLVRAGSDELDRQHIASLLEVAGSNHVDCDDMKAPTVADQGLTRDDGSAYAALVAHCERDAKTLVRRYGKRILHVALLLISNETLRASDVAMVCGLYTQSRTATKAEKFALRRDLV